MNKEVCLAYVPEAKPGDYVIVHVGFAISIVERGRRPAETFEILRRMGELAAEDPRTTPGVPPRPRPRR